MSQPQLSIVVPCHNEESNLPLLVFDIDNARLSQIQWVQYIGNP